MLPLGNLQAAQGVRTSPAPTVALMDLHLVRILLLLLALLCWPPHLLLLCSRLLSRLMYLSRLMNTSRRASYQVGVSGTSSFTVHSIWGELYFSSLVTLASLVPLVPPVTLSPLRSPS